MKHINSKRFLVLAFLLISVLLTTTAFRTHFGLDSYSVYLNNKLILSQAVNQPLTLESLQLNKANASDKLVIYYSQCNADNKLGKGRSLVLRDNNGNLVKEWKFSDPRAGKTSMEIPVKDLLQMESSLAAGQLSLFYTADGMAQAQKLVNLKVKGNS